VIGQDKYTLFVSVAAEKEQQQQIADGRLEGILSMPTGQEQDVALLKFVQWSMAAAEKEIRNDLRIKTAFSGQGEQLDKLITTTKVWMESMFASRMLHENSGPRAIQ
jgi:UDP-N-acetylglucosamine transferase subunit ALG13